MSAFESTQFLIIENSKQCKNFNVGKVTNVTFQKGGSNCGIFKYALKERPSEFHSILRIEQAITLKGQRCDYKILESTINSFREWVQST